MVQRLVSSPSSSFGFFNTEGHNYLLATRPYSVSSRVDNITVLPVSVYNVIEIPISRVAHRCVLEYHMVMHITDLIEQNSKINSL